MPGRDVEPARGQYPQDKIRREENRPPEPRRLVSPIASPPRFQQAHHKQQQQHQIAPSTSSTSASMKRQPLSPPPPPPVAEGDGEDGDLDPFALQSEIRAAMSPPNTVATPGSPPAVVSAKAPPPSRPFFHHQRSKSQPFSASHSRSNSGSGSGSMAHSPSRYVQMQTSAEMNRKIPTARSPSRSQAFKGESVPSDSGHGHEFGGRSGARLDDSDSSSEDGSMAGSQFFPGSGLFR